MKPPEEIPETEIWVGSILTPAATSSSAGAPLAEIEKASAGTANAAHNHRLVTLPVRPDI